MGVFVCLFVCLFVCCYCCMFVCVFLGAGGWSNITLVWTDVKIKHWLIFQILRTETPHYVERMSIFSWQKSWVCWNRIHILWKESSYFVEKKFIFCGEKVHILWREWRESPHCGEIESRLCGKKIPDFVERKFRCCELNKKYILLVERKTRFSEKVSKKKVLWRRRRSRIHAGFGTKNLPP